MSEQKRQEVYPPYDRIPHKVALKAADYLKELGFDQGNRHTCMTHLRLSHYLLYLNSPADEFHLTSFENVDPVISHMVAVPAIPFWSACSHHCLPFTGTIGIGYVPNKKLIGLSKIPLLVRSYARGFWLQEHLANSITDALEEALEPMGLGVYIEAQHTCQLLDLVQPPIPVMKTTILRGILMHGEAARMEFYQMILQRGGD